MAEAETGQGAHLFFETHLQGDMDSPEGARHLSHFCSKAIHLIIREHPAAAVSTTGHTYAKLLLVSMTGLHLYLVKG